MTAKRILLIDDDADDRDLFCEALEEAAPGIICYAAANGRKALSGLEAHEFETPDLILLDINMPVMNGWQCLAYFKEQEIYKNIPVIIYSTSSYPEEVNKARQAGALCLFTKPSGFDELKKSLVFITDCLNRECLPSLVQNAPLFRTASA